MQRILVFSTNYLPFIGGAELAIKEITGRLDGYQFDLIAPRFKRSLPRIETVGRITVHRVGIGARFDKFLIPLLGFLKGYTLYARTSYGAVWCMMASHASIAAAFFKFFHPRVPLVLTLQEGDEEEHLHRYALGSALLYKLCIRPWHTLVFRAADLITVISKHLEIRAHKHAPTTPLVHIPNGVDVSLFSRMVNESARERVRKQFGFQNTDFVSVTVSRLVKKNRVDTLIRAIQLLPATYKLLIVGSGALLGELRSLVEELGVSTRVVFVGIVSAEVVPEYLAAADAFVRVSASEGFGSAFVEAMAAGVPVIATPVGGITDFLIDKKTGLLCGVGDARDLALKIEILAKDTDVRSTIIAEAKRMVSERYDWSIIAGMMRENVFDVLLHLKGERVLLAAGIYPPDIGGPAQYAKELKDALFRGGYAVGVVYYSARMRSVPTLLRHLLFFFKVVVRLGHYEYLIVLDTFSAAVPAVFAASLFGKPIVVRTGGDFLYESYVERTGRKVLLRNFYHTESPYFSLKERLVFRLTRWVLSRAFVIFSTAWQRDLWSKAYQMKTTHTAIVENFYAPPTTRVSTDEAPSGKVFLASTRPLRWKNLDTLTRAFARVVEKVPDAVLFTKLEPYDACMKRMESCYAVVLVSLGDISPNMILDAIRAGRPFICTREVGIYDRIQSCGIYVDPLDETAIARAMLSLFDAVLYQRERQKVLAFRFTHSWDDVAREFLAVCKQLYG